MRLYQMLADVIDYPGSDLSQRIDECIAYQRLLKAVLLLLEDGDEVMSNMKIIRLPHN